MSPAGDQGTGRKGERRMPSRADVYTRRFGAHDHFAEEEPEPLCDTQREGALQGSTHLLSTEGVAAKPRAVQLKNAHFLKITP